MGIRIMTTMMTMAVTTMITTITDPDSTRLKMRILFLLPLAGFLLTGCVTRTDTVTTTPPGPSLAEIQAMVQAHVSDPVIVGQIQNSPTRYSLTADQIITLKTAGASDTVLTALINTAGKPPVPTTTVVQSSYVYPAVYVDPWPFVWWGGSYYYGGYYRGGGYYYRGGSGYGGYHGH